MATTCEKIPVFEKDKALRADILIGCSIPKSYSKKKHALCVEHKIAPAKKPDVDNILKAIFDALNGYAYADDSQIIKIKAEKIYTEEPFVEVEIYEL
jgi:Holliday junction resolvase RusA-like endonuclease